MTHNVCHFGDCRDSMRELIAQGIKVQTVVTSPPYWGLRDYGVDGQMGLEEIHDCLGWATGNRCGECYVCHMVEVFHLARELLLDNGTLWLNLGDSYAGSWGAQIREHAGKHAPNVSAISANQIKAAQSRKKTGSLTRTPGLKNKDLIMLPSRVAMALQADGWYLRSKITWCKPNGMPESVQDRPTTATEEVFLLSKSDRYYYDAGAIRMPPAESSIARWSQYVDGQEGSARANGGAKTNGNMKAVGGPRKDKQRGHSRRHAGFNERWDAMPVGQQMANGSNLRNWWIIPPEGYDGAHFAVMPPAIARICVEAGSRPGDTVFDPFFGSGTTGQVAQELGRQWIGCELNPEYEPLQKQRTAQGGLAL